MVAATPTDSANPAGLTHWLIVHVGVVEEVVESVVLEPVFDVTVLMLLCSREPMAEIDITVAVYVKQAKSSAAGEELVRACMEISYEGAQVGKARILIPQGSLDVQVAEFLEPRQHLAQIGWLQTVHCAVLGRDRREAYFEKPQGGEMLVNTRDLHRVFGHGHSRHDRTRGIALQQALHPRQQEIVRAFTLAASGEKGAPFVMQILGAVDTDRQSKAVFLEEVDDLIGQQRAIGRQGKIDFLATHVPFLFGIGHNFGHELEIEQCFATKEDQVYLAVLPGSGEEKVHAGPGRVPVHL